MITLYIILMIIAYGCLLILAGFRPEQPKLSKFEQERLLKLGDKTASDDNERQLLVEEVMTIIRASRTLLIVLFVLFAVMAFDWLFGIIIAVIGLLSYEALARQPFVYSQVKKLLKRYEPMLFLAAKRSQPYIRPFRGFATWSNVQYRVHSREELTHVIQTAGHVITHDEQQQLTSMLQLHDVTLQDIMTNIDTVHTVEQNDLMGPLLLHELHTTGRSTFPVIDAKHQVVVGTISIKQLLTLEDKTSHKVKTSMQVNFPRLQVKDSIAECLKQLLETETQFGIVYNVDKEAVGVVDLEACLKAVFGRTL